MDLTACPECGHPAEIEWRAVLESTDGPIEHAHVSCVQGHWFLLPVELLARAPQAATGIDGGRTHVQARDDRLRPGSDRDRGRDAA